MQGWPARYKNLLPMWRSGSDSFILTRLIVLFYWEEYFLTVCSKSLQLFITKRERGDEIALALFYFQIDLIEKESNISEIFNLSDSINTFFPSLCRFFFIALTTTSLKANSPLLWTKISFYLFLISKPSLEIEGAFSIIIIPFG